MPLSGTYAVDPVHSSVRFRVHHGGIAFFRGYFEGFEGTLDATGSEPVLTGATKVENISIRQPDFFRGHVMGDEFFAADQYPEITFTSTSFKESGGDVTVEGDLTIRDNTKPITATGHAHRPLRDARGDPRRARRRDDDQPPGVRHNVGGARAARRRPLARRRRDARVHAAARSPGVGRRLAFGDSGMLPCLRCGEASRFVSSVSSAVMSFGRVSWGTITSSRYPRSAAV